MFFIKSFYKSLYDFKYYKFLHEQPKWKGFLYLLILTVILGLIIYIPVGVANKASYKELHGILENNCPEFSISENTLEVIGTSPHTIYDQADKSIIIVIDDTGVINEYDYDDYATSLLILKDKLYIKMYNLNEIITYDRILTLLPSGQFNRSDLLSYFTLLQSTNFLFVTLLVLFYVLAIQLGALVIGLFGRFLAIFKKIVGIKIFEAYAIACYASTFSLLGTSILLILGINFRYLQLVYILIGILYFWNSLPHIFKPEIQKKES